AVLAPPRRASYPTRRSSDLSGSTPVASGSRVPVWPAFSARSSHLTFCKAWLLERPSGLSSSNTPCTGRRCTRARGAAVMSLSVLFGARRDGLGDQGIHVGRALGGAVEHEMQRRHGVDVQALEQAVAQETGGRIQAGRG